MCINRRNFIKTAGLLGGACALAPGCVFAARQYLSAGPYTDKSQLPTKFKIDACTLCQLDCPWCPSKNFKNKNNYFGYLKFKDFKKFVDNNKVTEVELSNDGEIFLNPELIDIIKYAHKKNIILNVRAGVNGNTISDEVLEGLVKYQVRDLFFSIDGASQEIYSIYRRGGDFDKVIENIKKINAYKKQYNSLYPVLTWKYIIFGHNVCDMRKAKQMAKDLGMSFHYSINYTRDYSPIKPKDKPFVWMQTHNTEYWDMLAGGNQLIIDFVGCLPMFYQPQIGFDGQLLGCCCDEGIFKSNVFRQDLMQALNSPDFVYAKKMIIGQVPEKKGIICTNCPTYKFMKKSNNWLDLTAEDLFL